MTARRILVFNPNSNGSVTEGLRESVNDIDSSAGVEIECRGCDSGPFGIESDADIQKVIPLVVNEISSSPDFDVYIIACYSDPGLHEARTITSKPVLGIQESAITLSATYGRRFGVVALGRESIQRHIAYVRQIGMQDFHAGERAIGISVDEARNDPAVLDTIIDIGRQLIDEDGAETIVLGCAGMAAHRRPAQRALGVPVIDPTQAALELAMDGI